MVLHPKYVFDLYIFRLVVGRSLGLFFRKFFFPKNTKKKKKVAYFYGTKE